MHLIFVKHLAMAAGAGRFSHWSLLTGIQLSLSSQVHSPLKLKLNETLLGFSWCFLLPEGHVVSRVRAATAGVWPGRHGACRGRAGGTAVLPAPAQSQFSPVQGLVGTPQISHVASV